MTGRERTDQEVKQIVTRAKRLPEFILLYFRNNGSYYLRVIK